jgi:tight adherence protein B
VSAVVAAVVFALAWSAQRARAGRRRWPHEGASWAQVARRPALLGRVRPAPITDPAPLLRFRAAIERGASVVQAFESVAAGTDRWSSGARRLVQRVRAGAAVQVAIDGWVDEQMDPSARLLADALAISASTGGSHLRAIDAVIDAVRDRAALQREVRALASQAQTSAVVLVLLPVAFAVAVAVVDPRVRDFYVGSPLGPACIVAGLVLDLAGAGIMLRLVRAVA